jgi:hypothetical protein
MILFLVVAALLIAVYYGVKSLGNPAYAFGLYLVLYPMEQLLQSQIPFFVRFDWLANFTPPVLAMVSMAIGTTINRRLFVIDRLSLLSYGLYAFAALSVVWSQSMDATLVLLKFRLPYIIAGLLIMPLTISKPDDARKAFRAFVTLAIPVALALALVPFKGRGVLIATAETAEAGNPLAIGTFGATLAVVAMGYAFAPRTNLVARTIAIACAFLGAYVTLRSGSRGQFFTVLVGIAVVAWTVLSGVSRKNFLLAFVPSVVVAILLLAVKDAYLSATFVEGKRSFDRWSMEYMSNEFESTRVSMSYDLLKAYLEGGARNPAVFLFGLGGSYSYALMGIYCHVVPLEVLCEYGILAFTVLLAIFVIGFRGSRALLRRKDCLADAKWPAAVIMALAAVHFVLMFKQGNLLGHSDFFGYLLILDRIRVLGVSPIGMPSALSQSARLPGSFSGRSPGGMPPPVRPATI